jgi:hypothetical protein
VRSAVVALIVGAGLCASATAASAHPLGNFTVNRYGRVEATGSLLRIYYVLDEAELPAFQERDGLAAGRDRFIAARAGEIAAHLRVVVDGSLVPVRPMQTALSQPPGQGGLTTL